MPLAGKRLRFFKIVTDKDLASTPFFPEQDRYGCFLSYSPDGLVDFIEGETVGLVVQHGCYLGLACDKIDLSKMHGITFHKVKDLIIVLITIPEDVLPVADLQFLGRLVDMQGTGKFRRQQRGFLGSILRSQERISLRGNNNDGRDIVFYPFDAGTGISSLHSYTGIGALPPSCFWRFSRCSM